MPALDAIRDLRNSRSSLRPASREDPSAEPQQQAAKLSKLKALSDADKDVIASLQTKIKEQQNELDNRTTTINAIQRNFEQLSTIALAERAELQKLREAAASSSSTNAKRDKQTEALREELRQLQAESEAQSTTSEEALAAAKKAAAEERGRLHAKLAAAEQRLASAERRLHSELAARQAAEARAADDAAAAAKAREAAAAAQEAAQAAAAGAAGAAAESEAARAQAKRALV